MYRVTSAFSVSVDAQAPRSLWTPSERQTGRMTSRSKVGISSRVPVMKALWLMWCLPSDVLVQSSAPELWIWSEYLQLCENMSAGSLESVIWPKRLRHFVLHNRLAPAVTAVLWPDGLQIPGLSSDFKEHVIGVVWPASPQRLDFGPWFNQPIARVVWPASLQQLWFGDYFNQPVVRVAWPARLQQLHLGGWEFN